MFEKEVTIKSDAGVHARPAMMIVREAMKFSGQVNLIKGNTVADCKSIMSVLGLAIVSGTTLRVRAEGDGDEDMVNLIVNMIKSDFKI